MVEEWIVMRTKINEALESVLRQFGEKYFIDGIVNKSKVIQDLDTYDEELLTAFLSNEVLKDNFTIDIAGNTVLQTNQLIDLLEADEYWQDSYTKYSKKIGLTAGGKFIDENEDVVLDFPYKDTILKASMSKEDTDKDDLRPDEPFLNEVIAKEEIDVLLDKKIFVNAKKYDENGVHDIDSFDENDNLIIKGNNLLALHTLKERYAGKVKLIYIDPPYNTGNDSFKYNDKFNRSTWLTFMKNRLVIAKQLLSKDGSIYVQIDNNEVHYLKVLMDEIFGENNFQREIIWVLKGVSGYKSMVNNFVRGHDTILFYSNSEDFLFNKHYLPYNEAQLKRFTKVDEDGRRYKPITKTRRMYLDEAKGVPISDVWDDIASFQTVVNAEERVDFPTQKPEKLLKRIVEASSNERDIVVDFNMGSGTTQAVAHKMNRRYIGIEQMDYIHTISVPRLQKVIEGEQGGISKDVKWQGGGSFVYVELMEKNKGFIDAIRKCETKNDIDQLFNFMLEEAEIDFRVDLEKVKDTLHQLSLDDQKRTLFKIIEKNQLYYNYSEIDDENVRDLISDSDYKFNKSFYEGGE